MKYWLLKGDLPTNIQEHFQAVELTDKELKYILKNETTISFEMQSNGLVEKPNSERYSKLGHKIRKVLE